MARMPTVSFIGAGRLARALGPALRKAGYPVGAVASRSAGSARRLARLVGAEIATTDPAKAVEAASVISVAVPDGEIEGVALDLAAAGVDVAGCTVLHHSGALGPEPLRSLARRGSRTAVLHPLQSLSVAAPGPDLLRGCFARIEGDPAAARTARRIARSIGMKPLALPRTMTRAQRERYHAAASLASNDLLALLSLAAPLLEDAGLSSRDSVRALLPLMRGTLQQAEALGIESALTGPVVRGDTDTLDRHLRRLRGDTREAHRVLSRRLVRLVRAMGSLDRATLRRLRRVLEDDA